MNEILLYSLVLLAGVFCASCSQILLKMAAGRQYKTKLAEYLNARVIFAYAVFFASFVVSMVCLRHLPLTFVPILESSGYIFVAVLGRCILQERLTKRKLAGMLLIIAGTVICSCSYQ